jgi:ankyrin repeat protein
MLGFLRKHAKDKTDDAAPTATETPADAQTASAQTTPADSAMSAWQAAEAALFSAATQGSLEALEAALAAGASGTTEFGCNDSAQTALMAASCIGNAACAKRLAALGDVNRRAGPRCSDALMWAAWGGSAECVAELLAAGADPTAKNAAGMTAADYAQTGEQAQGADHARCAALLEEAAAARSRLLASSARNGAQQTVRENVDPRALANGRTPLMVAAEAGDAEGVRRWVPLSDLRQAGDGGLTALMLAARAGSAECARLLAEGGDAQKTDDAGMDALMHAAGAGEDTPGRAECARRLLPGSDPLRKDREGKTALLRAVLGRRKLVVEALLPASDPLAVDAQERNALDWAMDFGDWGVAGAICERLPDAAARAAIEKALNALDPALARRAKALWGQA